MHRQLLPPRSEHVRQEEELPVLILQVESLTFIDLSSRTFYQFLFFAYFLCLDSFF